MKELETRLSRTDGISIGGNWETRGANLGDNVLHTFEALCLRYPCHTELDLQFGSFGLE